MQKSNLTEKLSMGADGDDSEMQKQKEFLENCTLLYHFASKDLHRFAILQEVFGARNVVKLIQDLPSEQRIEAIDSMVYEATARLQDPAFGCTGIIQQLQRKVSDLESQITATQTIIKKIRSQQATLLASIAGLKTAGEDGEKFSPRSSASLDDDDQDKD